jgi:hypothetical protein
MLGVLNRRINLSKYAWGLKSQNKSFRMNWSIMKKVPAACPGMKVCSLCTEEKRMIMLSDKNSALNIRSELFSKCRHRVETYNYVYLLCDVGIGTVIKLLISSARKYINTFKCLRQQSKRVSVNRCNLLRDNYTEERHTEL